LIRILLVAIVVLGASALAGAQTTDTTKPAKGGKAFALSILVPGLGHRYAGGGQWGRSGSFFLGTDIGLWVGLFSSIRSENHLVQSYTSLAALRSGTTIEGKSRAFELSLANFDTSDEYIDELLRSRQWDRLDGAQAPGNQWDWSSGDDRKRYAELRDDAESADRRTTVFIGALVANRLISGLTSVLRARKTRPVEAPAFSADLSVSSQSDWPVMNLRYGF